MDRVRTVGFLLMFYGLSVPIVLASPLVALFGEKALIDYTHFWARFMEVCLKRIMGVRIIVEGTPPDGTVLFAAKHESYFETLALARRIGGPAVVMKRELLRIPVWGWAAKVYGTIPVDRSASATALRAIMRAAGEARAKGRSVLIFPEGTRVSPGEAPPLKSGFAGLYRALELPVVPVAVQSGHVWRRNGAMRSGVIRIRFGASIPPCLPRREAESRVYAAMNALEESQRG